MIPPCKRVYDSCSDGVFGQRKRGVRAVRGGAGWKRGTDWFAISWGACLPAGKGHGREQE